MSHKLPWNILEQAAASHGLLVMGVKKGPFVAPIHEERLTVWQNQGFAGEMEYMRGEPKKRLNPLPFAPETRTLLSFALPYMASPSEPLRPGFGRIARYALSEDYHQVIRRRLKAFRRALKLPKDVFFRPITDSFPLLERAVAEEANLGFIGKNTMLIRPKLGSFHFLAEILTSLEIVDMPERAGTEGRCGRCTRCIDKCPTQAFSAPYVLDSRRCISYLTIEKRSVFTPWESEAIGEWLFGCDICQEVCPFNFPRQKSDKFPVWKEFQGDALQIELAPLFELRDTLSFKEHFKGRAILRTGREGLLRNALAVIANTQASDVFSQIAELAFTDASELVRGEAQRTATRF